MQQIERYGVIALVFLLVTIVAISFWGDSKSPGFWSRLTGKAHKNEQVATAPTPPVQPDVARGELPLSPEGGNVANQPIDVPREPGISTTDVPGIGLRGDVVVDPNASPFVPIPRDITAPVPGNAGQPPVVHTPPQPQPPAPAPAPRAAPTGAEYVVKGGDSLARIARTQLGAESRWQEIAALNPGVNPKALSIGQRLKLPAGAAPQGGASPKTAQPKAAPRQDAPKKDVARVAQGARTCTVRKGDTLSAIARRELGDERLWKNILAVNPGLDPKRLAVGQSLHLPAPAGAELVAAMPSSAPASSKPRVR